jgi:cytidyltransferase-like protein
MGRLGKIVMIAGKFDPCHDGHIQHIRKAAKFGDYLLIVTHSDEMIDKIKYPKKHNVPLWARRAILKGIMMYYRIEGDVAVSLDEDGTVTKTLKYWKPAVFVKGGDRIATNMPKSELEMCEKIGCEIVYGVGDLLNSSTRISENG